MDPEKTRPFELGESAPSQDACILIHGFTGSPWDMRPLGDALAERGYRVKGVRLPGHGGAPDAMTGVSFRDWEEACEIALESLSAHPRVFVAGLSMGALLSLLLAAKRPERVHGLALLAPAIEFRSATLKLLYFVRNTPLLELLHPWVTKNSTDIADPIALAQAPILERFPSARLHDLYALREKAMQLAPSVVAPALVACGRHDHVVTLGGAQALAKSMRASPAVRVVALEEGSHIIPRDYGKEVLFREVGAFFDSLRK